MSEPDAFVRLLVGRACRAVVTQEFWHHGRPADLVNVAFVQVGDGRWARFYFDAGAFVWQEAAPAPIGGGEPAFEYRLVDRGRQLGVEGQRIEHVTFTQPDRGCARLRIGFERGALILDDAGGRTRLAFVEGAT